MLKRLLQDPAFTLTTIRGVVIRVHASFLFLPFWAIAAGINDGRVGSGSTFMVALVMLLYVCALMHEVGHIAVARRFGARVSRIRVSGLGAFVQVITPAGMAPKQDFLVAIGGPAASALLSLVLLIAARPFLNDQVIPVLAQREWPALLVSLAGANVLLTAFNLLPVFPMDGGQALNALLARYLRQPQATRVVSVFGMVVAGALVVAVPLLSTVFVIRLTTLATAGLVLLISFRAQRAALRQLA
ncbi:MAG TPA: site-2 protease family protein [Anaerolineae bacterium]